MNKTKLVINMALHFGYLEFAMTDRELEHCHRV